MNLNKFFVHRFIGEARKYITNDLLSINYCSNHIVKRQLNVSRFQAMAQTSITSFFKFTPLKSQSGTKDNDAIKENMSPEEKGQKTCKRPRLESSGSESELMNKSKSSASSEKKKKPKRQRIDSSGSETEPSKPAPVSPSPSSPKSDVESPAAKVSPKDSKLQIKEERTESPKTYASPKSQKGKTKVLKEGQLKKEKVSPKSNKSNRQESSPKSIKSPKKEQKKEANSSITEDKKENLKDLEQEDSEFVPVPDTEYDPAAPRYHPLRDACWPRGAAVPYLALARTFQAIEPVSSRLRIVEILSNYFRSVIILTPEDLLPSIYLCLNQLAPAYHSLELGIAETTLLKAVGACTGRSLAQARAGAAAAGGVAALAASARAAQRTMFPQPPLLLRKLLAALRDIARTTGQASVNKKIAKIQSLYVATRQCEALYLIRSLEGKLRIGLAEQSVLQALALATATSPPGAAQLDASRGLSAEQFKARVEEYALTIKSTYCACPNYDEVVPALLAHGVPALPARCRLRPGVPLKPMLAHPTRGVHEIFDRFEGSQFTCEWKYDGERAQIHVPAAATATAAAAAAAGPDYSRAAIFSRNQEDNTGKYPDVLARLPGLLGEGVTSCVLDCEVVAWDPQTKQILPFQVLSTRKRKAEAAEGARVAVCVFVFDLLLLDGAALVRRPLAERRRLLRQHFREVPGEWQFATSKDCKDMEEVQQFLEEAVRSSCEGLMVKTLSGDSAQYDIARRSHNWLKLKKDYLEGVGDTIDVVIIGAYLGKGRRRAHFGGFLAACRDPDTDTYQALCKLGTGFTDEDLASLTETLKTHEIPEPRNYYSFDGSHRPDAWFSAAVVWEVRCADLSLSPHHRAGLGLVDPDRGISLRFPRFVRVRPDKTPEQATSAQQLAQLYLAQDQVKNTAGRNTYTADDFY